MALHPNPARALVIGLGAGATAGAVSRYDGSAITVVELSPSVVRATGKPIRTLVTKSHVAGVTCITPQAPTEETICGWKPDAIQASARARLGSTP